MLVGSIVVLTSWGHAGAMLFFFLFASVATKVAKIHRADSKKSDDPIDDDARTGRGAWQVLAVAAVPALLCLLGASNWRQALGIQNDSFYGSAYLAQHYTTLYLSYLACCSADTLGKLTGLLFVQPS
jgi:uncharacterized membrane protein